MVVTPLHQKSKHTTYMGENMVLSFLSPYSIQKYWYNGVIDVI